MNAGHEDDELKPYQEPEPDFSDDRRIEIMLSMGFKKKEIEDSLRNHKYDDPYATYLLLGRRSAEVRKVRFVIYVLCRCVEYKHMFEIRSTCCALGAL